MVNIESFMQYKIEQHRQNGQRINDAKVIKFDANKIHSPQLFALLICLDQNVM